MRLGIIFLLLLSINKVVLGQMPYKDYTDEVLGFSIQYPGNWEYLANPRTAFIFIRPIESQGQMFRENVNLVLSSLEGPSLEDYSLEDYSKNFKQRMTKYLQGYKEISTSIITINYMQYVKLVYTHTFNGLPLKVELYMLIKDNKAYSFTCSALETNYDSFSPVFYKIIKSFKFLK
jgi:hypothetical protein